MMSDALILTPSWIGGLGVDVRVVVEELEATGRSVGVVKLMQRPDSSDVWRMRVPASCDLAVTLETPVVNPPGRVNVFVPNPEWFRPEWLPLLVGYDVVAVKTRAACEALSPHHPRVREISFRTPDHPYRADLDAPASFLLVAGKSRLRETARLVGVWARHPTWPRLTVVATQVARPDVGNVWVVAPEYRDRAILGRQWREAPFHFCLSLTEGWGHYALESAASGAVLVYPGHPPFDELLHDCGGIRVASNRCPCSDVGLARCFTVDEESLEYAVESAIAMSRADREEAGQRARATFDRVADAFAGRLRPVLDEACGIE